MAEQAPKTNPPEEQKEISRTNWADEDDDGQEDEDVEIGGSSVAQVGQQNKAAASQNNEDAFQENQQQERTLYPKKPRAHRERNIYGDFVVTKINIKEKEIIIPKNEEEEEEEESSEEEEEEQAPEEEPEEEKKGKSGVFVTSNLIDGVLKNCGIRFAVSPCQIVEQEGEEEARRRRI